MKISYMARIMPVQILSLRDITIPTQVEIQFL